jgi:hypothetical protein
MWIKARCWHPKIKFPMLGIMCKAHLCSIIMLNLVLLELGRHHQYLNAIFPRYLVLFNEKNI